MHVIFLLFLILILIYPVEVKRYLVIFSRTVIQIYVFSLSLFELSVSRKLHGNSAYGNRCEFTLSLWTET